MENNVPAPGLSHLVGSDDAPLPILLRPGTSEDHPFVVDSWLQSYRASAIARDAGRAYLHDMKWIVRAWLARAALLVACDPEQPGAIWGWAVTRDAVLFYVYVRQEFRRQGIARALLRPYLARTAPVIFAAKTTHPVPIPSNWHYSFLAALRCLTE
jgi:GNAT superfamily N-acetyltransferase